ncbi:hypothetical protein DOU50_09155 [Enterobacter sp. C6]|nr:hypothetical protein DOU50_09155 [Enterobacter sp. C6]
MSFGIRTHKPTCQKNSTNNFTPRLRGEPNRNNPFRDYTLSAEPVSAMIMTKIITDEPGSDVKACKKGIK